MVQWSGLHTIMAQGPGSIPDGGTKIPQALGHDLKTEEDHITSVTPELPWRQPDTAAAAAKSL